MKQMKKDEPLLELIPKERLSAKQKAFRPDKRKDTLPMYRLLREPTHLDEFDWKKHRNIAIWRENRTLICIGHSARRQSGERRVSFTICHDGKYTLECTIYGKKDSAVAETATFFCSLQHSGESTARLEIYSYEKRNKNVFKLAALQAEQLAQILDANPTRHWEFQTGVLSEEQSVVLATRPYPLHLKLTQSLGTKNGCGLKLGGTAFVNALETRQSPFGSLYIDFDMDGMPFCRTNLFRLFQLEIFETLSCSFLDEELVLRPFYAKVKALNYEINAFYIEPRDFDSLDIVTNDLQFRLYVENNDSWEGIMISFLNRVAELGHFERFGFSVDCGRRYTSSHELEPVAEALVLAIKTNPKLTHLNLSDSHWRMDWGPHFQIIFKAVEEHKSLRTVILSDRNWTDDNYSWLGKLLSCNRHITVLDRSGEKISNGPAIDNLYLLNHIYLKSAKLLQESTALRPLLVEAALVKSASGTFQPTALLLSKHADVLCESILGVSQDACIVSPVDAASPTSIAPGSSRTDPSKRKARIQSSHAVKKAARNET